MKKAKPDDNEIVERLTLNELCHFCRADTDWVVALVEHGVVEPISGAQTDYSFEAVSVLRAKKARRLERDLGINMPGLALVLDLLEERDQLRRQLAQNQTL